MCLVKIITYDFPIDRSNPFFVKHENLLILQNITVLSLLLLVKMESQANFCGKHEFEVIRKSTKSHYYRDLNEYKRHLAPKHKFFYVPKERKELFLHKFSQFLSDLFKKTG